MQNKTGNMETTRSYKFRIYPALGQRESHSQGENRQHIPTGNANGLEELRTYPANTGKAPNL